MICKYFLLFSWFPLTNHFSEVAEQNSCAVFSFRNFCLFIKTFYIDCHAICEQGEFYLPFSVLYLYLSCLIALVKAFNIVLNKNRRWEHSYLISNLGDSIYFSPLKVMLLFLVLGFFL